MNNPHNPEFITKRPWYLGDGDGNAAAAVADAAAMEAASLQHQASHQERRELSLTAAEELLAQQRRKQAVTSQLDQWETGQWVEALKKNKGPYRMCQIIKIHKESSSSTLAFDLKFEDGSVEKKVKLNGSNKPRIKRTGAGSRTTANGASSATNVQYQETFASKRDKYHGYDRDKHNAIVGQRYDEKLAIRRELRQKRQQEKAQKSTDPHAKPKSGSDSDWNDSDVEGSDHDDSDDDEFVQRDADDRVMTTRLARQGGVGGAQMKVTARNLRIREDTAKYLRNLNVDSAYYDPKSRSMRDNPNPEYAGPGGETDFAGDNFARISGDAVTLAQQQLFAWENAPPDTNETSGEAAMGDGSTVAIHPQANPSQAELLHKKFQNKAQEAKHQAQRAVLAKYGGAEYLDGKDGLASAASSLSPSAGATAVPPSTLNRALRFGASTSSEQQYNRDGSLLSGNENKRAVAKMSALPSKYEENVFRHGHSTVWGSFFHKGAWMWGYSDDHSLMKSSYCTGETGRLANDEANALAYGTGQAGSAELAQARALLPSMALTANSSRTVQRPNEYDSIVQPKNALDNDKVQEALASQNEDVKKRKYHSMNADQDMTPEMMEAYRLQKDTGSDPMAKLGHAELLDYKSR